MAHYDRAKLKIKMIEFPNMSSAFESMWATQACVNGVLMSEGQLSFVKPLHKKCCLLRSAQSVNFGHRTLAFVKKVDDPILAHSKTAFLPNPYAQCFPNVQAFE